MKCAAIGCWNQGPAGKKERARVAAGSGSPDSTSTPRTLRRAAAESGRASIGPQPSAFSPSSESIPRRASIFLIFSIEFHPPAFPASRMILAEGNRRVNRFVKTDNRLPEGSGPKRRCRQVNISLYSRLGIRRALFPQAARRFDVSSSVSRSSFSQGHVWLARMDIRYREWSGANPSREDRA